MRSFIESVRPGPRIATMMAILAVLLSLAVFNGPAAFGQSSSPPSGPDVKCAWAEHVVDYTVGDILGTDNTDASRALNATDFQFVSLGKGGSITLEFLSRQIADGPGDDFAIREYGSGVEFGAVEVSEDGVTFVALGNTYAEVSFFDLSGTGLTNAAFVRITDDGDDTDITAYAGFDLDSIGVINCNQIACAYGVDVHTYTPGADLTGTPVPANALGAPNGTFVSLGTGGTIILELGPEPVADGPGDDIDLLVYEIKSPEGATVFASEDGISFALLGPAWGAASSFDLATAGLSFAKFIKIYDDGIDTSGGTDTLGFDLDAIASMNCDIPTNPAIDIEKATNGDDADTETGPTILVGDPVVWTYVVTNTGDVALHDVAVTDNVTGAVSCPKTVLAVGESMTCTVIGTATLGQYANIGLVTGIAPNGATVEDEDPSHYIGFVIPEAPMIDIEKATNGHDADAPTGPEIPVGDAVLWTYVVTNSGNVDLVDVMVTDDQGVAVTCPKDTLVVGESMTCTADGTATEGQYKNLGTVMGVSPAGTPVDDTDPSHYLGFIPDIQGGDGCTPGFWKQKHHFEFWTNYAPSDKFDAVFGVDASGDKTFLETVKQGGGKAKALGRHAVAALLNAANTNVSYLYTEAEVIALVQQAYATGEFNAIKSLLEEQNELGCTAKDGGDNNGGGTDPLVPAIDVEKATNGHDADLPTGPSILVGDDVVWTYLVTNQGEVTLTNISVIDDQGVLVICPLDMLAVGASMECSASGTAIEGQYGNIGTAAGTAPDGAIVTSSDPSHYFGTTDASSGGGEGLTPGFWKAKHHYKYWVGYEKNDDYATIFGVDASFDKTLLGALKQGGGKEKALGRHAVAALLNATHLGIDYMYTEAEIIALVQEAYATGDFNGVKDILAEQNEKGGTIK